MCNYLALLHFIYYNQLLYLSLNNGNYFGNNIFKCLSNFVNVVVATIILAFVCHEILIIGFLCL